MCKIQKCGKRKSEWVGDGENGFYRGSCGLLADPFCVGRPDRFLGRIGADARLAEECPGGGRHLSKDRHASSYHSRWPLRLLQTRRGAYTRQPHTARHRLRSSAKGRPNLLESFNPDDTKYHEGSQMYDQRDARKREGAESAFPGVRRTPNAVGITQAPGARCEG